MGVVDYGRVHILAFLRGHQTAHPLNMWLFTVPTMPTGPEEYVSIFMAWPYANGPLHLGHVAGNCLPADIQYKYERMRGRRVLMLSGSDEHGTPITVTADETGKSPQAVVDENHDAIFASLVKLGCSWGQTRTGGGWNSEVLYTDGPLTHAIMNWSKISSWNSMRMGS